MTTKPKPTLTPGAGNIEVQLGEHRLVLRPTLNAALNISRMQGGIRGALDKVAAMDLDAIVSVIRLGIGAEESRRLKNLDELVFSNGLMDSQGEVLGRCLEFLAVLARGGRPADDESAGEGSEDPPSPETQS